MEKDSGGLSPIHKTMMNKMKNDKDPVNNPLHYTDGKIEVGDQIEWSFDSAAPELLKNRTFTAEVAIVNEKDQAYGVYASYGQDHIPFDRAVVV